MYLDEQQQVDILGLGSLTVLVANVVLLNVNTLQDTISKNVWFGQ